MAAYDLAAAVIRPARPEEADSLTELSIRSKAYWGYDAEFMAACIPVLTMTPDEITTRPMFVLEADGRIVGFYSLERVNRSEVELFELFVEPDAIGGGGGARLWRHAVLVAKALDYLTMTVESDPFAEGFYRHMGMTRYGERESEVRAGRHLPLLRIDLAQALE